MRKIHFMTCIFFIVFLVGCGLEPKTLSQFYKGDL